MTGATGRIFDVVKQQRIVLSCALVVGLVLVLLVHAPVLPVLVGCLFAMGVALFRSLSNSAGSIPGREGR